MIAIIGSGVSGVTCARILKDAGYDVVILDRSRGIGGRFSSRNIGNRVVDFGMQYFSGASKSMQRFLEDQGMAEAFVPLPGRVVPLSDNGLPEWDSKEDFNDDKKYLVAGNKGYVSHLSQDIDTRTHWRVMSVMVENNQFILRSQRAELLTVDAVVFATPAPITLGLIEPLAEQFPDLVPTVEALREVQYTKSIVATFGMENLTIDHDFFALESRSGSGDILWLSQEQKKRPEAFRSNETTFVMNLGPAPSEKFFARDDVEVWAYIERMFEEMLDLPVQDFIHSEVHRVEYAKLARGVPKRFTPAEITPHMHFIGDAFAGGPSLEDAIESGIELAKKILHDDGKRMHKSRLEKYALTLKIEQQRAMQSQSERQPRKFVQQRNRPEGGRPQRDNRNPNNRPGGGRPDRRNTGYPPPPPQQTNSYVPPINDLNDEEDVVIPSYVRNTVEPPRTGNNNRRYGQSQQQGGQGQGARKKKVIRRRTNISYPNNQSPT